MTKVKVPADITISNSEKTLKELNAQIKGMETAELDLSGVTLNSITKALVRKLHEIHGDKITLTKEIQKEVFYYDEEDQPDEKQKKKGPFLEDLGEKLIDLWGIIYYFCVIMVDMIFYSFESLYNRKFILKDDTTKNAYYIGYKAITIVFLLAFLIGLTIALQAAIQLAKMGGQGYIAMMITVIMTTELGPLITAIIIAGRTGSSIAAEIGTMVVMEEVDALKTMGIKPLKFLLVPKFWAFTLVMPILTLIADIAGITGGLLIATAYNIPFGAFMSQMIDSLEFSDIFWGTVKSISFAWMILAVGSFKGLNVRGGADAVGRATTESVVVSIFLVVAMDAIFSILLYT
jgi:phospholipid/cholesterol/gamma-HCH transport system permease protein